MIKNESIIQGKQFILDECYRANVDKSNPIDLTETEFECFLKHLGAAHVFTVRSQLGCDGDCDMFEGYTIQTHSNFSVPKSLTTGNFVWQNVLLKAIKHTPRRSQCCQLPQYVVSQRFERDIPWILPIDVTPSKCPTQEIARLPRQLEVRDCNRQISI
ncbi:hypothetical protein QR680_015053 [Steinernema hermaphroditum]|uniref:Uncharacterized protein n=1 Tax=Steinernema hermaphroditum TaxID=289476 RepID=A0AA39M530_9BILA|nr:hypothetical protein QR680_015053 [Steinernema hermaphroditum]